ncbi:MAG: radical SAM protein [Candidatus Omnitrophota bacterium]
MHSVQRLKHLIQINSVEWLNLLRRLITFLPEFYLGNGHSSSLINIVLELTHKCNLQCSMCHYGITNNIRNNTKEMDLGAIKDIIVQGAELKTSFFLTGGEPFMRSDLIEIVKTIKKYRLKCGINTNGTILDKKKVNSLMDMNLDYIFFSVLGSESVHDELAEVKGAYKKMVETLSYCSKRRKKTKIFINQVITKENIGSLKETVFLAKNNAVDGVRFQHLSYLTPDDICRFSRIEEKIPEEYEFKLSGKEFKRYDFPSQEAAQQINAVTRFAKENKVELLFKPFLDKDGMEGWYGHGFNSTKKCVYPWLMIRIAPNGDVFACPILLMKMGNVLNDKINVLLNNERFRFFRRLLKQEKGQFPICARCCKLYMSPFGRIKRGR